MKKKSHSYPTQTVVYLKCLETIRLYKVLRTNAVDCSSVVGDEELAVYNTVHLYGYRGGPLHRSVHSHTANPTAVRLL